MNQTKFNELVKAGDFNALWAAIENFFAQAADEAKADFDVKKAEIEKEKSDELKKIVDEKQQILANSESVIQVKETEKAALNAQVVQLQQQLDVVTKAKLEVEKPQRQRQRESLLAKKQEVENALKSLDDADKVIERK